MKVAYAEALHHRSKGEQEVPLSLLRVDTGYARGLYPKHVQDLVDHFDYDYLDRLRVSLRDEMYFVIDGWHRAQVLGELEWPTAPCYVMTGLTYQEEALMFGRYNNGRKGLKPVEKFKSLLQGKDELALTMRNIADEYGLVLLANVNAARQLSIPTACSLIKKIGPERFRRTLEFTLEVYPEEASSYLGTFLDTTDKILSLLECSQLSSDHLAKSLASAGWSKFMTVVDVHKSIWRERNPGKVCPRDGQFMRGAMRVLYNEYVEKGQKKW